MTNSNIPVRFTHNGQYYDAVLTYVHGAAARTWHLMINNYYRGQLILTENGFAFYSQTGEFKELTDYFGDIVTAWEG